MKRNEEDKQDGAKKASEWSIGLTPIKGLVEVVGWVDRKSLKYRTALSIFPAKKLPRKQSPVGLKWPDAINWALPSYSAVPSDCLGLCGLSASSMADPKGTVWGGKLHFTSHSWMAHSFLEETSSAQPWLPQLLNAQSWDVNLGLTTKALLSQVGGLSLNQQPLLDFFSFLLCDLLYLSFSLVNHY